jgi:glycosyltransferase involved in cell wall biosynthesis
LDFLKAAEQIMRDSTRSVSFFLVGEVCSHSYFKQISRFVDKNGLKRHVVVTGRRDDMPQVLSSLDIIVSLSGGTVMFEAMACGKPVISAGFSTREGSMHIQNGHTGILVESRQNSALVETLMRLIDNPELRVQIGLRARKWAQSNFSHIRMAASTQRLYSQLLQG